MASVTMSNPPIMKLELVPVPVTDIDRARKFYVETLGFHLDHDIQPGEGRRIVQLTPPGSACSILLSAGLGEISEMQSGALKGLHLVVGDVAKLRSALADGGLKVSEVVDVGGYLYVDFCDPDGNQWMLQEMPERAEEFGGNRASTKAS